MIGMIKEDYDNTNDGDGDSDDDDDDGDDEYLMMIIMMLMVDYENDDDFDYVDDVDSVVDDNHDENKEWINDCPHQAASWFFHWQFRRRVRKDRYCWRCL